MNLLPDVPLLVVVLHLAALAALLSYGAVTQVRRLLVLKEKAAKPERHSEKTSSRPAQLPRLRHQHQNK